MKNVSGQVSIFIIVAIVVFVSLAIFFLSRNTNVGVPTGTEFTPDQFMDSCVRQAVRSASDRMIAQGGVFDPSDYRTYNGTRVAYLCKNVNYYASCINQYPRYMSFLGDELKSHITGEVDACLAALKSELEKRSYTTTLEKSDIQLTLKPSVIDVSIPGTFTLTKNGVTQTITAFTTVVRTPLYDLGSVTQEIVSQEAQYCYFEYVGYMLLYPLFDIRVTTLSDATKLYTVTHTPTHKQLRFAVRGCAFPAGV